MLETQSELAGGDAAGGALTGGAALVGAGALLLPSACDGALSANRAAADDVLMGYLSGFGINVFECEDLSLGHVQHRLQAQPHFTPTLCHCHRNRIDVL